MGEGQGWRQVISEALSTPVRVKVLTLAFVEPRAVFNSATISRLETGARLFLAKVDFKAPPFLIYDPSGRLQSSDTRLVLRALEGPEVAELEELAEQYPRVTRLIEEVAREHGWRDERSGKGGKKSRDSWRSALDFLAQLRVVLTPEVRLKSLKALEALDWSEVVEAVVDFGNAGVDPRLKRVRLATFLQGIVPSVEPNALVALPSGVGKSGFYEVVGHHDGKVTASGLIGYAKSGKEIYSGSLDGVRLPYAIDQIDEQSAWQIARFLFDLLEMGTTRVSTGGTNFSISFPGPLIFLSNPGIGESSKSFGRLIEKLTFNPAFGRRLGLILYMRRKAKPGEASSDEWACAPLSRKLSRLEEEEWRAIVELARAVEEVARPRIEGIYHDSRVWDWLNAPMPAWQEQALQAISSLEDELVHNFLAAFVTAGTPRLRNAALRAAIFLKLKDIALGTIDIDEILALAEDLLPDYLDDALNSLREISASWAEERALAIKAVFESLPKSIREIVSACELYRRTTRIEVNAEIDVGSLSEAYKPASYAYLSEAIRDALRGNPIRHNERLRRFFGIELKRVDRRLFVTFLQAEPVEEFEPIGFWRPDTTPSIDGEYTGSRTPSQNSQTSQSSQNPGARWEGCEDWEICEGVRDRGRHALSKNLAKALHWANQAWGIWQDTKLSWKRNPDLKEALTELYRTLHTGREPGEADLNLLLLRIVRLGKQGGLEAIRAWVETQLREGSM